MPKGRVGSMRKEDAAYRRYLKAEAKREKAQMAALRRADARGWPYRNPALKPVRKSTGWLNGPAGTNTQIKFKKNPGGRTEVYIRRKARPAAKRRAPAKRKTSKRKGRR